jgi:thiamine pyrophosphokinase
MNVLLVCASPENGAAGLAKELAAEADLVIAVDGGGTVCRDANVVPDVLLGDFDSIDAALVDELHSGGARVVRFPAEKDATDLELAFAEARLLGATQVTVTAASGGRLDHTLGVVATLAANSDLLPHIEEPGSRAWLLADSARREIALGGLGAVVSLIPLGGDAVVTAKGFRWGLERAGLGAFHTLGVSNVVDSNRATVEVHAGKVLVVSPAVGESVPAHER